ncbi:MAG: hypothetical protein EOM05_02790 [Clostridia bacterium]|nr:hypothetical protein [Clostridia bacterium]
MNDKFLNMLGLCKKAQMLSAGHDGAFNSISKNKAKLCFLSSDASPRLKKEFESTVTFEDRNVPLIYLDYSMEQIQMAIGSRAAVITINDKGFARKLTELNELQHGEDND